MVELVYALFLIKISYMLETVVFLLGKKNFLASRYHVFHHSTLPLCVWIAVRYYPGYNASFLILINAIAHMILLGYFVFVALFPELKEKTLWWKSAFNWIHVSIINIYNYIENLKHQNVDYS